MNCSVQLPPERAESFELCDHALVGSDDEDVAFAQVVCELHQIRHTRDQDAAHRSGGTARHGRGDAHLPLRAEEDGDGDGINQIEMAATPA